MVTEAKIKAVGELVDRFSKTKNVYIINYQGITVEKLTRLRSDLKANQSELKIFKNTLTLRALRETKKELVDQVEKILTGTTAIVFANDPVAPAKVLTQFAKENATMKINGAIVENVYVEGSSVKEIANLPSKEVLIAKLLMLFNSPITGFVGVLQGNIRNLVCCLSEIERKKGT
ncbi:MAG: 50S ribosomal protein L10 [Candidatus Margulisiibacteriota bacterium]